MLSKEEIEKAKEDYKFFNEGDYITKEMSDSKNVLLEYIEQLETKIKELGKGQQALMQSRRKWKNRYYKTRNKNKDLQKTVEQIYDDYQDIGKIAFDYSDKIEQLEKTISRKMSNNKRLSKKYIKERYKNKKLESDKQKLIEKLEKVKQKDEEWNALNGELAVWTFAQEILSILKGENQVTVK